MFAAAGIPLISTAATICLECHERARFRLADLIGGVTWCDSYWTTSRENLHVWGQAYAHDYGCGLKDCADASNVYFQAGRLSGSAGSNAVRVSAATMFGGVGINVGVSFPAGVSAGFTDGGSEVAPSATTAGGTATPRVSRSTSSRP
jgi:hypothetical protein